MSSGDALRVDSRAGGCSTLFKIRNFEKQQDVLNILHGEDPDHYSRLWMAGFLKYVGYSLEEICDIIDGEANWNDYDARKTWCHVQSVFQEQRSNPAISSRLWERSRSGGKPFPERVFHERIKAACAIAYTSCQNCPDPKSCRRKTP